METPRSPRTPRSPSFFAGAVASSGGPAPPSPLSPTNARPSVSRAASAIVDGKGTVEVVVTTVCGSGRAANYGNGYRDGSALNAALMCYPIALAVDSQRQIIVLEMLNNRIRRFDPVRSLLSTIAGTSTQGLVRDGSGDALRTAFNQPKGLCVDPTDDTIIVADTWNFMIRRLDVSVLKQQPIAAGTVSVVSGFGKKVVAPTPATPSGGGSANEKWVEQSGYRDGSVSEALFCDPTSVCADLAGNIYVSDRGNARIRKIDVFRSVSTIAGSGQHINSDGMGLNASFLDPRFITLDASGHLLVCCERAIRRIDLARRVTTLRTSQPINPFSILVHPSGQLIVSDDESHSVLAVHPTTGAVTVLAGSGKPGLADGVGTRAQFHEPRGLALDPNDPGQILVCDARNNRIRKLTLTVHAGSGSGSGTAGTAGSGGTLTSSGTGSGGAASPSNGPAPPVAAPSTPVKSPLVTSPFSTPIKNGSPPPFSLSPAAEPAKPTAQPPLQEVKSIAALQQSAREAAASGQPTSPRLSFTPRSPSLSGAGGSGSPFSTGSLRRTSTIALLLASTSAFASTAATQPPQPVRSLRSSVSFDDSAQAMAAVAAIKTPPPATTSPVTTNVPDVKTESPPRPTAALEPVKPASTEPASPVPTPAPAATLPVPAPVTPERSPTRPLSAAIYPEPEPNRSPPATVTTPLLPTTGAVTSDAPAPASPETTKTTTGSTSGAADEMESDWRPKSCRSCTSTDGCTIQ